MSFCFRQFIKILFFAINAQGFSQCENVRLSGVYKRESLKDDNFQIYQVKSVEQSDISYIAYIDTLVTLDEHIEFNVNDQYSLDFHRINNDSVVYNILEKNSGTTTYLGSKRYFNIDDYGNTSDFLFYSNGYGGLVFNFKSKNIRSITCGWSKIVGYDNDFIYLYLDSKYKIEGKNYYNGTILQLDSIGYKIIHPQSKKQYRSDDQLIFFNSGMYLTRELAYTAQIDCRNVYYFKYQTYYNNVLTDSSIFENDLYSQDQVYWEFDTLTVFSGDLMRLYHAGKIVSQINIRDSIAKNNLLKDKLFTYNILENSIAALVQFNTLSTEGLRADGIHTLNGVLQNKEDYTYSVLMLFDKNNYQFLGYPEIKLVAD